MSSGLLKSMGWRRALKRFAPTNLVKQSDVDAVLEAARLAPTSFGVQPFHIHVVTNKSLKEKLAVVSYNQPQVTQCSHLLVFTARNDASTTVERFIDEFQLDKNGPDYAQALRQTLSGLDKASFENWAARQAHIALGFSLTAAADLHLGSCPMSGFVPDEVHKVLGLPANELPVAYLAIGQAPDENDAALQSEANPFPKLRLPLASIVRKHE